MFCDFQKLPRVNKDLAEKLLEEEQRTDSKKRQKVGLSLSLPLSLSPPPSPLPPPPSLPPYKGTENENPSRVNDQRKCTTWTVTKMCCFCH